MNTRIFPIHLNCLKGMHGPDLGLAVWNRIRISVWPDKAWYMVECTIDSLTTVDIRVYDIADDVYGGRGDLLLKLEVPVAGPKEHMLLQQYVEAKKGFLASTEYYRRQEVAELTAIQLIQNELFGVSPNIK